MRTVRLRRVLHPREDPNHPVLQVLSVYREHGVVPKSSRTDNFNKTPEDLTRYLRVFPGDLVVNKMKAWSGSVAVSNHEGIVSGDYLVCAPSPSVDSRFLHHTLRSQALVGEMRIRSRGIRPSQERLYWDDLAEIEVVLPALEAQRRIADFLDDQVARIDNIIAARGVELQRLDASQLAQLDSAFDVGSQPLVRLALFAAVQSGITVDGGREADNGVDVPYLRVANVQAGTLDLSEVKSIRVAPGLIHRYRLQDGDVLMTEGGDIDKLGRGTVWRDQVPGAIHQNHVFAVRVDQERLVPDYLAYATACTYARDYFEMTGNQTTNLASTSATKVLDMRIPVRSVADQTEVIRRVAKLDEHLRSGRGLLANSINVLAELKRSLITAAVTGEFDVSSADGSRVPIA